MPHRVILLHFKSIILLNLKLCHFEDTATSIPELKSRFFQLLFEWVKGLGIFSISWTIVFYDYFVLLYTPSILGPFLIKFSLLIKKKKKPQTLFSHAGCNNRV